MRISVLSLCSAKLNREEGDDCTLSDELIREYKWRFVVCSSCAELDFENCDNSKCSIDEELDRESIGLEIGGDSSSCFDDDKSLEVGRPAVASNCSDELVCGDGDNSTCFDDATKSSIKVRVSLSSAVNLLENFKILDRDGGEYCSADNGVSRCLEAWSADIDDNICCCDKEYI